MTARQFRRQLLSARCGLIAALWLFGLCTAHAQPAETDPPGRVARIAETSGPVWLQSPDNPQWIPAVRNQPVTRGDRLSSEPGARAELDLGSTTLRLDGATEVEVVELDDQRVVVDLHAGSLAARVRDPQALGDFLVTTADGGFRVQGAGHYRFDHLGAASQLTVYGGQAIYEGPGSALTLPSGQRGEFWIGANGAAQYRMTEPVADRFSSWLADRDRAESGMAQTPYVSPEMTGAPDLERYGRWEQSADYGPVWFPSGVAAGWAPYSTGHWVWISPWGWTWVDDAPWGFAPFHYGRWVYYRNAWCWTPGPHARRPVYAPALVAWIGSPGLNVSLKAGAGRPVGWFPLGPHEAYVPGYRASARYGRELNASHGVVDDVGHDASHREFRNRKYPHAVTVVPASVIIGREPVQRGRSRLRDDPAARALVTDPTRLAASLAPPLGAPPQAAVGKDTPWRRGREEGASGGAIGGGVDAANPWRGPPGASSRAPVGEASPRRGRDRQEGVALTERTQPASPPGVPVRPAVAPPPAVSPRFGDTGPRTQPPAVGEGTMRTFPRGERDNRAVAGREHGSGADAGPDRGREWPREPARDRARDPGREAAAEARHGAPLSRPEMGGALARPVPAAAATPQAVPSPAGGDRPAVIRPIEARPATAETVRPQLPRPSPAAPAAVAPAAPPPATAGTLPVEAATAAPPAGVHSTDRRLPGRPEGAGTR